MKTLGEMLNQRTREGELFEKIDEERIRCLACGHLCPIPAGAKGVCKVRYNLDGRLMVPFGYVAGAACDPIEKKPFFHVRPGAAAFSFGMLGCDLHCSYCQNWLTSQALRDPGAGSAVLDVKPDQLVRKAVAQGAEVVVSTYNEPLITSEWAVAIFREAKEAGLMTGFVSNGNGTPQVLEFLQPWLDIFKVDLKSFDDRKYRKLGGRLQPVLETIRWLFAAGLWVEIVSLMVPGFNDSEEELAAMATFIAGVSADIPWHVTAFHPDYRMTDTDYTAAGDLARAAAIGHETGLNYVYAGNIPGALGKLENTNCPKCGRLLIERRGFRVISYALTPDGRCPSCAAPIPGRWAQSYRGQKVDRPMGFSTPF